MTHWCDPDSLAGGLAPRVTERLSMRAIPGAQGLGSVAVELRPQDPCKADTGPLRSPRSRSALEPDLAACRVAERDVCVSARPLRVILSVLSMSSETRSRVHRAKERIRLSKGESQLR